MSSDVPNPGHRNQSTARSAFRVLGALSMLVALVLTDVRGLAGVGRTVDGPSCRGCGARNDAEARFCDGCGQSLG